MKHPVAKIYTTCGTITMELYPECAPNTCCSFIALAKAGCYDHRAIRRIVPDFVLQPSYNGFDDPQCTYDIAGEFPSAGFANPLHFRKGTVAMGADETVASGSEWYIVLSDDAAEKLDGHFPAFGMVTDGWEEVERLVSVPTRSVAAPEGIIINEPIAPEIIESVTVETWGIEYPPPKKL